MKTSKYPRLVGGIYTRDAQAIQFRMPAGFPGDVNRTHPFGVEAVALDGTHPPTLFGQIGVIDATSHLFRVVQPGDTGLTDVYGAVVRPFPTQQQSTTNFGAAVIGGDGPQLSGQKADVLRSGYIMTVLNNFAAAPSAKGGSVFVWVAATIANHVQGFLESAASGGNTMSVSRSTTTFNGPPDATGNVEFILNA